MIEAYKIITRKENIKSENFFHIYSNGYYTTGHCFKLIATTMVLYLITMLPLSRLELRRNFFSQRVVSNWNSLSVHVIEELFQNPVMPLFGIVFGVLRKLLLQNSLSPPNTIPKSGMNSLPDYVVDVDTVDIFKSRLDKFWKDQDIMFDCDADLTGAGNRSEFELESD